MALRAKAAGFPPGCLMPDKTPTFEQVCAIIDGARRIEGGDP